jgi:hypothetical protein
VRAPSNKSRPRRSMSVWSGASGAGEGRGRSRAPARTSPGIRGIRRRFGPGRIIRKSAFHEQVGERCKDEAAIGRHMPSPNISGSLSSPRNSVTGPWGPAIGPPRRAARGFPAARRVLDFPKKAKPTARPDCSRRPGRDGISSPLGAEALSTGGARRAGRTRGARGESARERERVRDRRGMGGTERAMGSARGASAERERERERE